MGFNRLFCLAIFIFSISTISALGNPAATYCNELGYHFIIEETPEGDFGYCIVEENKFPAWDFFEGAVGQEYSYCASLGLEIESVNGSQSSFSSKYAICINATTNEQELQEDLIDIDSIIQDQEEEESRGFRVVDVPLSSAEIIRQEEAKELRNIILQAKASESFDQSVITIVLIILLASLLSYKKLRKKKGKVSFYLFFLVLSISLVSAIPSQFDYRDYKGENWISPVKSQGVCNSCWAFASLGSMEALINIEKNDPTFNADLAEQHIVSNYSSAVRCSGGINAGFTMRSKGIVDEECFNYKSANSNMDDICGGPGSGEWSKRLSKIKEYSLTSSDHADIKEKLIEKGPLYVQFYMSGHFVDGIYSNCGTTRGHAGVLVGYNDEENSWIIKNSWGSGWADGGYFKMDYDSCPLSGKAVVFTLQQTTLNETIPDSLEVNGNLVDTFPLEEKDDGEFANLTGIFNAKVTFDLSKHINSSYIFLNLNQKKTNNVSLNISYCQETYYFTIQENLKLARFNLCEDYDSCQEITSCNATLNYVGEPNSQLQLDWLTLEALKDSDFDGTYDNFDCSPNNPNVHQLALTNTTWSNWTNISCIANDVMNQSRSLVQYDLNACENYQNKTIYEYRAEEYCNCQPEVITESTDWEFVTECSNDTRIQRRNVTQYDKNACAKTDDTFITQERETNCFGVPLICQEDSDCADSFDQTLDLCTQNTCSNELSQIIFKKGWNLVAFPFQNQITPNELNNHCRSLGEYYYEDGRYIEAQANQTLSSTQGIFVLTPNECSFNIQNLSLTQEIPVELEEGWNLLSFPTITRINEYTGDCNIQSIWNFQKGRLTAVSQKAVVLPIEGLWINVETACTLYKNSEAKSLEISEEVSPPSI